MKKLMILGVFLCQSIMFLSCSDFLELTTPQKIAANEWFYNEKSLEIYANGFLDSFTPTPQTIAYGDADADYVARISQSSFFYGSWSPNDQGGWSTSNWSALYNINYFLQHMRETPGVDETTLNHYEAVGRFWRAWFYFDKIKTFGAVPWYEAPIDAEDEVLLYKERDSREYVFHKMLEDLNYAAQNCSVASKYVNCGVINGYIVNAFKSRVCLFEGTYRKYHKVDPSTQIAWTNEYETSEDLLRESVSASDFVMESGIYKINHNSSEINTQYRKIFTSEKIDYSEVLWAREYIDGLYMHPLTWYFNSATSGSCWSMNKSFLHTYLNRDGTRYTDKDNYNSTPYTEELNNNRDARIAQTIITPGYTKKGVSGYAVPNFQVTRTGYQIIKWNIDDASLESTTLSYNSIPIMRYAEVLLNYAEAKAELGEFTSEDWSKTIALLRQRAGVATDIPANADEYLINYFDNTVTDAILLEIRRERGIELFMENLRYQDIMRWHLGHLIERPWVGLYCPIGEDQDLCADGSKKVTVVNTITTTPTSEHQYLELSTNKYISVNEDDCLVFEQTKRVWNEKMYLRPIPQTAIDINNNLEQNPLWK